MEPRPVVETFDLVKVYGEGEEAFRALDGISLSLQRGRTLVLIGPSGSGKSTLLRAICNLDPVDGGHVVISGRDVTGVPTRSLKGRVGMVFQSFNLFPHLSALGNVSLAQIQVLGRTKGAAASRSKELLELVGLGDRMGHYPGQLSGGQQQRVAIARTLAMDPEVVLFDEPTSALDPETVGDVLEVMKELAARGTTMVVATHEMDFARDSASAIAVLEAGRVIEYSEDAEAFFRAPQQERTKAFLARVPRGA